MFSLTVMDHVMIAHSFQGEQFGPAQKLHGATFTVEAEFRAPKLDPDGLLIDIGLAQIELKKALATFNYDNLDVLPQFKNQNTTTEFLAFHVHGLLSKAIKEGLMGPGGAKVDGLKVLLRESPVAWAAFEGPLA